jgi:cation transport protein ChaC
MMISGVSEAPIEVPAPPDHDFWVFGYGSLMWHPVFSFGERQAALVYGYHRTFCIYSHRYRGTPETPGLVLGLDRGGSCRGIAYRIDRREGAAVFAYLYDREMITKVYHPRWLATKLADHRIVRAYGFVADTRHGQYTGRLSEEHIVALILQGSGERGACLDYLSSTVAHLDELGIRESKLHAILRRARSGGKPA